MKPDNTCGSCPIWLAALEGDGLDNWDSIFEACRKQGCFSTPTEDFILCRDCIDWDECEDKEWRDGCYFGVEEEK